MAEYPRKHDDAPVSEETKRALDKQLWEAENDVVFDESAMPQFDPPDVGRSTMHGDIRARTDGVTTSQDPVARQPVDSAQKRPPLRRQL